MEITFSRSFAPGKICIKLFDQGVEVTVDGQLLKENVDYVIVSMADEAIITINGLTVDPTIMDAPRK
jgi:hypothetical protein